MNIQESLNLQTAILLVSIAGIIISIFMMIKNKDRMGWIIPPLTLFINVFFFTSILHIESITNNFMILSPQWTLIWSAAIRLHALLLGIIYIIIPIRSG
jgi:hypothetical protein